MSPEDSYDTILDGCRSGRILVVAACLIEAGHKRKEFIKQKYTSCDGEIYSPFLIAVRNGHARLVSLLLEKFEVNPCEHSGTLSFDGYLIDKVTPLWCAAACGYLGVVKELLEYGAQVNQTTSSNSTPLRAACFHGKLSVVMHLVENGADLNIPNKYDNTCLMVSSYRGNIEVVDYLLKQNINVNQIAQCGGTALHFACESGQTPVVKALVEGGCDIEIKNNAHMTAAMVAADACRTDVIEYFTTLDAVDSEMQIMLLELLGSSYANDKDKYNLNKTYHYLFLALLLRKKENIPKKVLPPVTAYDNRKECDTVSQLQAIQSDQDAIQMEALMVRERILGVTCPELLHPIVYRGAVYADGLVFSRCIQLWKRSLHLRQINGRPAHNDLLRFAEVFSQMLLLGERIDLNDLHTILESTIQELKHSHNDIVLRKEVASAMRQPRISPIGSSPTCMSDHSLEKCQHCKMNRDVQSVQQSMSCALNRLKVNLNTLLYLLAIVCKVITDPDEMHQFGKLVYRFLKEDIRDSNENTLLHLVVSSQTHVDDFHVKDVCAFPNADVTKFLLSCGADPNARNNKGNTPMHIIVQYDKIISDFITLHRIITLLLDHGGHHDVSNHSRKTPASVCTTGVAEIILKTQTRVTLKCLAARTIRDFNIAYKGKVPRLLNEFVEMH